MAWCPLHRMRVPASLVVPLPVGVAFFKDPAPVGLCPNCSGPVFARAQDVLSHGYKPEAAFPENPSDKAMDRLDELTDGVREAARKAQEAAAEIDFQCGREDRRPGQWAPNAYRPFREILDAMTRYDAAYAALHLAGGE